MSNNYKLMMAMGIMLLPVLSLADAPIRTAEMSRDVWLERVRTAVSVPVCKGFTEDASIAEQMKAHHVSYANCIKLIPAVADKCIKKYYASLPTTINDESAEKWGQAIGECIGNDFAMNYL